MITRLLALALGSLALGGCITPLVGLGVQLGAEVVGAGIDAASGPSEPEIEAYCWDPEKQSASTSTSPSCWSPQVKITEDEYEKFKETGVAPPVNTAAMNSASVSKQRYCANPQGTYFYVITSSCAAGDMELAEGEWRSRHAQHADQVQAASSALVYCWDSKLALEYKLSGGDCGNDHRITEDQYQTQRARREEVKKIEQQAKVQQPSQQIDPPAQTETIAAAPSKPSAPVVPVDSDQPKVQASVLPQQIDLAAFDIPGSGTGFFVSAAGHVLTNEHVVSDCDAMATVGADGFYEASIIDSNTKFDLAVLKLPFGVDQFAAFAADSPEQGDDVFVVGYPLLGDFREIKITDGIVSGLSGPDHDTSLLQMTAAVQPGNSGGPLVNANGAIVGVVVGKYTGEIGGGFYAEGINFAVAHEAAAAFLSLNGVTVKRSGSTKELKGREIMRKANAWTVPLLCLSRKSAS